MPKKTDLARKGLPSGFQALCAMHPPRPIKSRVDLDEAVELVDRLTAIPKPTPDQEDYLETLTTLIEAYETRLDGFEDVHGVDALRALVETNDMTATDLSTLLGDASRSLGSRLLRGERELSKTHIKKLCERFAVSADLFV
jgi:HTH-type transcriptional regulator / antitoxin HigA